jgi:Uncharacterized protein conserved in bacteria
MNGTKLLRKVFLTILLILSVTQLHAQKTEKFYDFRWKECKTNEARFYSLIEKIDSGYCRKDFFIRERKLQMYGNYKDSLLQIRTGKFYFFYANGNPLAVERFVNNKKEGLTLAFHNNKMLKDSCVYSHGKQIGLRLSWHSNGILSDSIYTNADGSGFAVSWFDNGSISSRGKYSAGHNQDGLWKYYHKNGKISSLETYHDSVLIDKKYFDEEGIQMNDTTNHDRLASYAKDSTDWIKYLRKNTYYPFNQKIINGDEAVVVVTFTVNEDGMIENVYTSTPFSEKFDRVVVQAIKNSPGWYPAINHNRTVKSVFNQIVYFSN